MSSNTIQNTGSSQKTNPEKQPPSNSKSAEKDTVEKTKTVISNVITHDGKFPTENHPFLISYINSAEGEYIHNWFYIG